MSNVYNPDNGYLKITNISRNTKDNLLVLATGAGLEVTSYVRKLIINHVEQNEKKIKQIKETKPTE
jgi:hypothetical protein